MKRSVIALIMAITYLVVGNVIAIAGMHDLSNGFLNCRLFDALFAPYMFVAGMSTYAGWDSLSIILEVVIFVFTIPFFYGMLIFIALGWDKVKEKRTRQ